MIMERVEESKKEEIKMATKNTDKKSGFNAPTIGEVHPKGSTIKRNPDGTITIVPPKEKKEKAKK